MYMFPNKKTNSKKIYWYYFVLLLGVAWVWFVNYLQFSLVWSVVNTAPGIFLTILSLYGIIKKVPFSNLNIFLRIIIRLMVAVALVSVALIFLFFATFHLKSASI